MRYYGPKQFYALLGLPRSGTSIICRALHSLENGFCISEPFHREDGWKRFSFPIDKIGRVYGVQARSHILPAIYGKFMGGDWQFGGIKEVDICGPDGNYSRFFPVILSAIPIRIVIIERDPVMIYDSWMRGEFKNRGLEKFINTWSALQEIRATAISPVVINYGRFTSDPLAELNRAFGKGSFSGEINLEPFSGHMGPMDGGAKMSTGIRAAKRSPVIGQDTIERIWMECKP